MPKFLDSWNAQHAKIWVDKLSYQIIKCEIDGIPIEGYEDILEEITLLNVEPDFKASYIYEFEKNGVLFPGNSKVSVYYPPFRAMGRKYPKLKIDMIYNKYKFFTVETDHIIKKDDT